MTETYVLRVKNADATYTETELTPGQLHELQSGQAIAFFPHDERVIVADDGTITWRESAKPEREV